MAQSVLLANSGRQGAAGEGSTMGNPPKIGSTEAENPYGLRMIQSRDNFQCTYFRHRVPKTGKRNISWSDDNHVPVLSDSYSESDSESDNTIQVVRWLESLPVDQQFYMIEEDVPGTEGMNIDNSIEIDKIDDHWDSDTIIRSVSSGIGMAGNSNEVNEDISATRTYVKPVSVKRLTKRRNNIKIDSDAVSKDKSKDKSKMNSDESQTEDENWMLKFEKDDEDKFLERKETIKESVKRMDEHEELKQVREMMDQLLSVRTNSANLPSCEYERQKKSSDKKETEESSGSRKKLGHRSRKLMMSDNQKMINKSEHGPRGKIRKVESKENSKKINKLTLNREQKIEPVQKVRCAFTNRSKISKTLPARNEVDKMKQEVNGADILNRSRTMKYKLERNKSLLKNVQEIMDAMENIDESAKEENPKIIPVMVQNVAATMTSSITSLEREDENEQAKNLSTTTDEEINYEKPIFKNAALERMLDQDMEDSLNKYKRVHETWKDLAMKNSMANSNASYEPPTKRKKKPRSTCSESPGMAGQNFPAFESWQSIHKYFLTQSQC